MSHFIQLHLLTSYPPSNLNRDDLGQPKTARLGGVERLRISSQSLKRAWRTSEVFQQQLAGTIGTRTKALGLEAVYKPLINAGCTEKQATEWATQIAQVYGKLKTEKGKMLEIEQLVHISPEERQTLDTLVATLVQERRAPSKEELDSLLQDQAAVDIAMFGRMLTDGKGGKGDSDQEDGKKNKVEPKKRQQFIKEAAVQVAHAIGVHASPIEDDYFTAVDDLNNDDSGAGHVGESGFAQALFYQYICIDREQLKKNLGGDEAPDAAEALTQRAIHALAEAALKVGPTGKQNSYASRAYAHFALAEKGNQQPRSLTLAVLKPIAGEDYAADAVAALLKVQANMDQVYGACADERASFNVFSGEGSADALLNFVAAE